MDTLRKLLLAFGAVTIVMVLAAAPAMGTEAGGAGATEPAAETGQTTDEAGAAEHGQQLFVRNDEGKMVLPLDPRRPRDAVGWGLIGVTALAILLGLVNARKQLRGERGQATGEWRYR
jgi:hypothetical protein